MLVKRVIATLTGIVLSIALGFAQDFPTLKGTNARTGNSDNPALASSGQTLLRWFAPTTAEDVGQTLVRNNASTTAASRIGTWTDPAVEDEANFVYRPNPTNTTEDTLIGLQPAPPAAIDPGYAFAYTIPAAAGTDPSAQNYAGDQKRTFTWELEPADVAARTARSYALYVWLPVGPTYDAGSGDPIFPQRYFVYTITYGTSSTLTDVVDTFQTGGGWVRLGNGGLQTNMMFDYDGTNPITITLHNTVPRKSGHENDVVPDPAPPLYDWSTVYTDTPYTSVVYADAVRAVPEIGYYTASPVVRDIGSFDSPIRSVRALNRYTSGVRGGNTVTLTKGLVTNAAYDTGAIKWTWSPLDESEFTLTMDNDSAGVTSNPPWANDTAATGFKGTDYHSSDITNTLGSEASMVYAPTMSDGAYEIVAWLPGNNSGETFGESVRYEIHEGANVSYVTVNQSLNRGWVRIGSRLYNHDDGLGEPLRVYVTNYSADVADDLKKAYADTIRFVGASNLAVNSTPVMAKAFVRKNDTDPPAETEVVLVADERGRIHCLDAEGDATGGTTTYWTYPHATIADPLDSGAEMPTGFDMSSALVQRIGGADYLYIGAQNGRVYCIAMEGKTGTDFGSTSRVWTFPDDLPATPQSSSLGPISGSIAYSEIGPSTDPTIFVPTEEGRIYALDAEGNSDRTTNIRWAFPGIDASDFTTFTSEPRNLNDAVWAAPTNAELSDSAFATVTTDLDGTGTGESQYLQALIPDGLAIPGGSIINGVEFRVLRKRSTGDSGTYVRDLAVHAVKGGTILTGANRADIITDWPTSTRTATYGSASELWGTTWSDTDFGAGFGFAIAVQGNGDSNTHAVLPEAQIDSIEVRVYYSSQPVGEIVSTPSIAFGKLYFGAKVSNHSGSLPAWVGTTTYALGDIVAGSNGKPYRSVQAGNAGNDPTTDTTGTWWVLNEGGRFFALDVDDGSKVWEFSGTDTWSTSGTDFISADDFVSGSVTIAAADSGYTDDMVVVANQNRWITALKADDGTELWTTKELGTTVTGNLGFSPLTVQDGAGSTTSAPVVLVPTDDGRFSGLFALPGSTNIRGTRRAWEYVAEGDRLIASMAVGRGFMYGGDSAGYFYAFNDVGGSFTGEDPPGEETLVENNLTGELFRHAKVKFITRDAFQRLRLNNTSGSTYFTYDDATGAPADVSRTAFDWGETLFMLVYDFPYRVLDTNSNPVAPPILNFQMNVEGTAFRVLSVQSLGFDSGDATVPTLPVPAPYNSNIRMDGYAILAFTLQGGGTTALPPGSAQVQTSLSTQSLNNQNRQQTVALDPDLSTKSFNIGNPLALIMKFAAGVQDDLYTIGWSNDPAEGDNAVNGSPDKLSTNDRREDLLTAEIGNVPHNQTGRYSVGVVDRSLMTLLRGPTRGLDNVRVTRSELEWQGGADAVYKPIPQALFPNFEDLPTDFPNRSLDYPNIARERIRVTKSRFGETENPQFEAVDLLPPTDVDENNPLTRVKQWTLFDVAVDVPRFQPPNDSAIMNSALLNVYGGYYGRMRVFVDSNGDGLMTETTGRREAYRQFWVANGVPVDERFEATTPLVDLGSLSSGAGYSPTAPLSQVADDFYTNYAAIFQPFTILNIGNVNLLNLRMAKAYVDGAARPWDIFSAGNNDLGWLDGSVNLHSDIDSFLAPVSQVILQKPRVGDRVGTSLSPNPIRRENFNLGVERAPLLSGVATGNPKVAVSIPLGWPIGVYEGFISVVEDETANETLDLNENEAAPRFKVKFTVRESRLTGTYSDLTAPMVDDLYSGSERYRFANGQPTGTRDANGNLLMVWTSSRPEFNPADPAGDAEVAAQNPQWRLYAASVEGQTPAGASGASPLADLNEFTPQSDGWFRQDDGPFPADPDISGLFGGGTIVANTAKFGSPAMPAWGVYNPFNLPSTNGAFSYIAFVGDAQRQTDRGRVLESRIMLGRATAQPNGQISLSDPVSLPARGDSPAPSGTVGDPLGTKGKPSIVQVGAHATVVYAASTAGRSNLYYAHYDGSNWTANTQLDLGGGFDTVSAPSLYPRTYQGAGTAPAAGTPILEMVFSGKLQGSPNSDIYFGRFESGANGELETAVYMPERVDEVLTPTSSEGVYKAQGIMMHPDYSSGNDLELKQTLGGTTTSIITASTRRIERDTGLVSYATSLGGRVYIDPKRGIVRFSGTTPNKRAQIKMTYQPLYLRIAEGGAVNLTAPNLMFDERMLSEFDYWATASNAALVPTNDTNDDVPIDRYVVTFSKAAAGAGQTARPFIKSFRYGVQLPTPIHTATDGSVTLLQVTGSVGPYQVDPANGRLYFTSVDEDQDISVRYVGLNSGTGAQLPEQTDDHTVQLMVERSETPVAIEGAVNETQLWTFLDPFDSDDAASRRPGLIWLLWASTRNGAPDLFMQTIAPRFAPRASTGG